MYVGYDCQKTRNKSDAYFLTCKKREKARVEIRIKVQPGSNETILEYFRRGRNKLN